jgi:CcmD family protein
MRKILFAVVLFLNTVAVFAQPQTEFIPVTELPVSEQLPAAPLVIAAYAFVWLAFVAYVWVIWRRLGKVEAEISTLAAQLAKKRP